MEKEELFAPGHRTCAGCGGAIATRLMLRALGKNTIIAQSTGCLEVTTTFYPETSWMVPWIHVAFENAAAVASGIEAALKTKNKKKGINVVAFAGDGGTADIGLQALSGAVERGHDIIYCCYDNEAYMNTGIQRSGATPYGAWTTTSPPGKYSIGNDRPKKDVPAIVAAHGAPYVATASIGYPRDYMRKVERAAEVEGPCYVHVHSPCPVGWRFDSSKTIEIAKLAVQTGMWILYEIDRGKLNITHKPKERKPVEEYLKLQGRFRHLLEEEISKIQKMVDEQYAKLTGE